MVTENKEGQIITFYSYKGGVGRTMAVANVAFLAAQNGLRVLVMDWDLEAPGLAYYFRGLLDGSYTRTLKDTPGILNILWEWTKSFNTDNSVPRLSDLKQRFISGTPFRSCVQSLLPSEIVPSGAALDFIGAGSQTIDCYEPMPYEDALAHLSWSEFFDRDAGGVVLSSLRNWAKINYDLVLVDSRTGLADVAGICTMQLPDTVALCFILNRQNIEGIARVAGAIRAVRDDAVGVSAVPMRVAQSDTPEQSDAKARAISDLTRIGGFTSETVQNDFRTLEVLAADNVPFYETLAPFAAQNPKLDQLTLNYARLTEQLIGKTVEVPSLEPGFVELVRRRLQPRHATIDYLTSLKSAEPTRIVTELGRLIESAIEAETEGGRLDEEYLRTLVDAALDIDNVVDSFDDAIRVKNHALDLLRGLVAIDSETWKFVLIEAIERYLDDSSFYLDDEVELNLLNELDRLLSKVPALSMRLKRIAFRRKAAWLYFGQQSFHTVIQMAGEIMMLVEDIGREGSSTLPARTDEILTAELDVALLRGDVHRKMGNFEQAYTDYKVGLGLLDIEFETPNKELARIGSYLHCRLAEASTDYLSSEDAANHAIEAVKFGIGTTAPVVYFTTLTTAILRLSKSPYYALEFCESVVAGQDRRSPVRLETFYGREAELAIEFLSAVTGLANLIGYEHNDRVNQVMMRFASMSNILLQNLARRRQASKENLFDDVIQRRETLIAVLENFGLSLDQFPELSDARPSTSLRGIHGLHRLQRADPE